MDVLERIIEELTGDIIITQSEYDEKTIAEHERNNLLAAIFNDIELSWDGKTLRLVGDSVLEYIKVVYPHTYMKTLKELQDERRDKENADTGKGEA